MFTARPIFRGTTYSPFRLAGTLRRGRDRHAHEASSILGLEAQVLALEMCLLGILCDLLHGVGSPFVGWQELVNCLGVVGGDGILLSEVSLLDDRVGELNNQYKYRTT